MLAPQSHCVSVKGGVTSHCKLPIGRINEIWTLVHTPFNLESIIGGKEVLETAVPEYQT